MGQCTFDLRAVTVADVRDLFAEFHPYKSTGRVCTYAFAVFETPTISALEIMSGDERERERPVAAYLWQPPPPQSAKSVCPELPCGVLALSRMVAVRREDRELKHVSKPLRRQMRSLIDRTRWPVLITYSDESVGHNGYVYECSGWTATDKNLADTYTIAGARVSRYSNGVTSAPEGAERGEAWIQRWEHWAVPREQVTEHFAQSWDRIAVPGKFWRSGNQAYTYARRAA